MVDADTAADEADLMDDEEFADDEDDLGGGGSRFSGKKIVLFVVLPLFILIGAGAALYVTGMLDQYLPGHEGETAEGEEGAENFKGAFFEVPDLIVNLNSTDRQPRFLKISIQLELESEEDLPAIEAIMPRVIDHFQTYLRELRIEDLRGSAGIYRLRLELLSRVNMAARPVKVRDVLFQEILIQ